VLDEIGEHLEYRWPNPFTPSCPEISRAIAPVNPVIDLGRR
jgi:hypothetical protein